MSEKKYVVPEGMLKAATSGIDAARHASTEQVYWVKQGLLAAVQWLSEWPSVPDDYQIGEILKAKDQFPFDAADWIRWGAVEWQRRMFLAPEPPTHPELQRWINDAKESGWDVVKITNMARLFERAYALGREDGVKNGRV